MKPEELRIALFSGNYNYVRDGANQALNRLVGYLLRQGAHVRVYSPTVEHPAFPPTGDLVSVPSAPIACTSSRSDSISARLSRMPRTSCRDPPWTSHTPRKTSPVRAATGTEMVFASSRAASNESAINARLISLVSTLACGPVARTTLVSA